MLNPKKAFIAIILISLSLLTSCQKPIPENENGSAFVVSTETATRIVVEGSGWHLMDNGILHIETTEGARNWSVYNREHYYTAKWKKEWREEIVPNISAIVLSEGVTILPDHTALCCSNLNEIVLPETLEIIENDAIVLCFNLHELHVPQSVKHISGLPILTDYTDPWEFIITVDPQNLYYEEIDGILIEKETGKVLYAYSLDDRIVVPENVRSLARYSFLNCQHLKTICVPPNCEIDEFALVGNVEIVRNQSGDG